MPSNFRIHITSHFKRDAQRVITQNPELGIALEQVKSILTQDPYNKTRRFDIKKLKNIEAGKGQWRIRVGKYRLRYDILDKDIILYSFCHRKEAY